MRRTAVCLCGILLRAACGLRLDGAVARPAAPDFERRPLEGPAAVAPAAARWRPAIIADSLAADLLRHVLLFVPRSPQVVSSMGIEPPELWRSGEHLLALHGDAGRVVDVKFFPEGDRLITSALDGMSTIWSAWTGSVLSVFRHSAEEDSSGIFEAQVFPDGRRVVTIGSDLTAVVRCAASGEALVRLDLSGFGEHSAVRVFPSGDRLATGVPRAAADAPAVIWDVGEGRPLHVLQHEGETIRFLEVAPCGGVVLTVCDVGASIWDAHTGHWRRGIFWPGGDKPTAVAIGALARRIALSTAHGNVFVWDGSTGGLLRSISSSDMSAATCALLGGGSRVMALSASGMDIWDIDSGESICSLDGGGIDPQRMAIAGQGEVIAVCGGGPRWWGGHQTTIWDASACRRLGTIMGASPHQSLWRTGSSPCHVAAGAGGAFSDWVVA